VLLTAAAQNIKRMVRLLSRMGPKREAKTEAAPPIFRLPHLSEVVFRWILAPNQQIQPALI
jgi:hypothetical protein